MKIYIMTDLEGVAGVLDFDNWCSPESRYYEVAKEFLTMEVNSAVEGFFEGGIKEIVVADGHGPGGINPKILDKRVKLLRGWQKWPLLLDKSYNFVAFVGQHAKSRTEFAHIAHTQSSSFFELRINDIPIGEFGQFSMCASELGVRTIFASGDKALCKEAEELIPGIVTIAVKEGTTPGKGDECTRHTYIRRNNSAIHLHPEKARELIKETAYKSIKKAIENRDWGIIPLKPPFKRVVIFRSEHDFGKRISIEEHPSSVIEVMNMPFNLKNYDE